MTPDQLPPGTKERIEKDAKHEYGTDDSYQTSLQLAAYQKGGEAEATRYIPLLRLANCPELLIENPDLIKGKKPTDEDMLWAHQKVKEHLTYEQELTKTFEDIIEYAEDILATDGRNEPAKSIRQAATTALNNLK